MTTETIIKEVLKNSYKDNSQRQIVLRAIELTKKEVLQIINNDRDNGNIKGKSHTFSPALCLSKVIKYCEEK